MPITSSLDQCPPEIITKILSELDDLDSLEALIAASAYVRRVSDSWYGADAILEKHDSMRQTKTMMRLTAFVLMGCIPARYNSLKDLQDCFARPSVINKPRPRDDTFLPLTFPHRMPGQVLRQVLAMHRHLQESSMKLLQWCQDNLRDAKPRCPGGGGTPLPHKSWVEWELGSTTGYGVTYDMGVFSAPSWYEAQEVLRAFWRVQVVQVLKRTAAHSSLAWSDKDVLQLQSMSALGFFDLDDITDDPFVTCTCEGGSLDCFIEFDEMSEKHLFLTVMEYQKDPVQSQHLTRATATRSMPRKSPNEEDWWPIDESDCYWWNSLPALWSSCYYRYRDMFRGKRDCSFRKYLRFGFAIWNHRRMEGFGLARIFEGGSEGNQRILESRPWQSDDRSIAFVWRSMIDDIEKPMIFCEQSGTSNTIA